MVVGKNKGLNKGGKRKQKKIVDPFTKKEWYDVQAPGAFKVRTICKTLNNRTAGTKIAADNLRGRVFETYQADLNDSEQIYRKMKFVVEAVEGKNCLTNFHSMSLTRDKLCNMVKKWQTLIEACCRAKTTDGYELRLFCIGFTKKMPNQEKKTSYASTHHVKRIRKRMIEIMQKEVSTVSLKDLLPKLNVESISKDVETACRSIYPLYDVHIRKIKVTKRPAIDLVRLQDLHGTDLASGSLDVGAKVLAGPTGTFEPPIQASV